MKVKLLALTIASLTLGACSSDHDQSVRPNHEGNVTVGGNAVAGESLTASVVDINGIDTTTLTYTWFAGSESTGETGATYDVPISVLGETITVQASYTDLAGHVELIESEPTTAVTAVNDGAAVSITGTALVGETLTASVVDGDGISTDIVYQWMLDGVDIDGATASTYVIQEGDVGSPISVMATYTDNDLFDETPVSDSTASVVGIGDNAVGTMALTGSVVIGSTVNAVITDGNGFTTANYQWAVDGVDVDGATSSSYTLLAGDLGKVLSVSADYTDNFAYAESVSYQHSDPTYSAIATGEASLVTALTNAADGDLIALDSATDGDYESMAQINISASDLTVTRTSSSTAVISGLTCIIIDSGTSGITIDGLVFEDAIYDRDNSDCDGPDGYLVLNGTNHVVKNSEFRGEYEFTPSTEEPGDGTSPREASGHTLYDDPAHYIVLGGIGNVIERNLFEDKPTNDRLEGGAISMYVSHLDDGEVVNGSNTVQYNLFRNFGSKNSTKRESSNYAIQLGRSSGQDGDAEGNHSVQYNRFDNVNTNRRLIITAGGANTITGNTIVNSLGNVALEHGFGNTVSKNIIISNADNSEDSGISFAPFGHTIVDNYIGNVTATSADRAGLHIDSDPFNEASSVRILADDTLDLTTVVARNTIINNDRPVQFENSSSSSGIANCLSLAYILDFDDNLIANQSEDNNIFGSNSGDGDDAFHIGGFDALGCALDVTSDFDNNHVYATAIDDVVDDSTAAVWDFNGLSADNTVGDEDGATLTAPDSNLLVEGTGDDADVGVDIDILHFITEDEVGPNSTWTAED